MAKTLQLQFKSAEGKHFTITVDEPKENLTPAAVTAAMQAVIDGNVFRADGYPLETIESARIIDKEVTTVV